MGGICGKKNKGNGGILDKAKSMAFTLIASSGGGSDNESQFDKLKKLVISQFSNAEVKHEVDQDKGEGKFDVTMDGQEVHSKEKNGKVEDNESGIMEKVKNFVMEKAKKII